MLLYVLLCQLYEHAYNYLVVVVFSDNVTVFSLFVFTVVRHRNYYDIFCSSCCVFVTPEGRNKDYYRRLL